jgi:coenzyme F420-reducing hydrogenase delta subunit
VNPDRLEFYHVAASQGPLFAETSAKFTERIKQLNAGVKPPADVQSAESSTGDVQ